jgi:asparagine synthetase A
MKALQEIKRYIEDNLAKELNLTMVQVPLIVERESGVNDMLDRDGSRTPVEFPCGLGLEKRLNAQVVQAATKWKRPALAQFGCKMGEGINTDMKAVRKDYFLDHDHSSYVDQWDWERVMSADQRNLAFLKDVVQRIWKVASSARRRSSRSTRPSSSSASAGCCRMAIRTRIAQRTTMTGSRTPAKSRASRRTVSMATSWCGTRSPRGGMS